MDCGSNSIKLHQLAPLCHLCVPKMFQLMSTPQPQRSATLSKTFVIISGHDLVINHAHDDGRSSVLLIIKLDD